VVAAVGHRRIPAYPAVVRGLVVIARTGQDLVDAVDAAWAEGDAVLPLDHRLPRPAVERLLDAMAPTKLIGPDGSVERRAGRPVEEGDALVIATSGSTGEPKGVVHTHASLAASARAVSTALGVRSDDRWLCCLPLSHIAGFAVIVRARLSGIPVEVHDGFDADAVTDAARRGASLTSLVPTTLRRIDPDLFRRILVGGSATPEDLPAHCRATYGMTETGSAVVLDGEVLPGVDLRIVDDEIHVRGDMLLRVYRDDSDPRLDDGWFPTGDGGEWSPEGLLVVHGRRGDMIVTGGENVWPAPVEALLSARADIAEVAVIGRPDTEWGAVVTAVLVPTDPGSPPSLEELRDDVRAVLAPWCAPRRLELVDRLPRTALGKVVRSQL
jgi:O-succinylbenzoic acid--CoA ligase